MYQILRHCVPGYTRYTT